MGSFKCSGDVALHTQLFISLFYRSAAKIDVQTLGEIDVRVIAVAEHLAGLMEIEPVLGASESRLLVFRGIATRLMSDDDKRREVSIRCVEGDKEGLLTCSTRDWIPLDGNVAKPR